MPTPRHCKYTSIGIRRGKINIANTPKQGIIVIQVEFSTMLEFDQYNRH
jgi:hypothetical protein